MLIFKIKQICNKLLLKGRIIMGFVILQYYFIYFIILIAFVIIHNKRIGFIDCMELYYIFVVAFSLYANIGLYSKATSGLYSTNEIITYCMCSIVGISAFNIGYIFCTKTNAKEYIKHSIESNFIKQNNCNNCNKWNIFKKKYDALYLVICLLLLIFLIIYRNDFISIVMNIGQAKGYVETAQRAPRTSISGPKNLAKKYSYLIVMLFVFYRCFLTKKIKLIDIFLYLVLIFYFIAGGNRTSFLQIILLTLVYINYRVKMLKSTGSFLLFFLLLFFMVALANLRAANSILGMFNVLKELGLDSFAFTKSGEFNNTTGTLMNYIQLNVSGLMVFSLGSTYITELLLFIPTFLYPNRPLPLPEKYMLDFFPNAIPGTGHGWFILNDGYISFGLLGIAIELFLLGMLLSFMYNKFMKNICNPLISYCYAALLLTTLEIVRGSVLGGI